MWDAVVARTYDVDTRSVARQRFVRFIRGRPAAPGADRARAWKGIKNLVPRKNVLTLAYMYLHPERPNDGSRISEAINLFLRPQQFIIGKLRWS
jgi:hypothetical protein